MSGGSFGGGENRESFGKTRHEYVRVGSTQSSLIATVSPKDTRFSLE
jgi:hypothetical protein